MQIGRIKIGSIKAGSAAAMSFCCPWRARWRLRFSRNNRDGTGTAIRVSAKPYSPRHRSAAGALPFAGRDCRQRHGYGGSGDHGTPFVMVYRVSALTYALASRG